MKDSMGMDRNAFVRDARKPWHASVADCGGIAVLCLANWYGESILPVIALRKWTESYFRDAPVAVKRSEPRSTLRWRNSE